MKFLRTLKREGKAVKYQDHYISKCSECPDQIALFCIRKKVFVGKNKIHRKCPLPDF